jgi:hypothetical protein
VELTVELYADDKAEALTYIGNALDGAKQAEIVLQGVDFIREREGADEGDIEAWAGGFAENH